jgi:hypothetical protein
MIEVKTKPVVDLKAKMMLAKQKSPSLVANSNAKRQKTIEPDDTLESPTTVNMKQFKLGSKPPFPNEKNRSGKQPDQPRPDPRLEESACELISYSEQVIIGEMRDISPGIPK